MASEREETQSQLETLQALERVKGLAQENLVATFVATSVAAGLVVAAVAAPVALGGLSMLGFSSGGVAAGSIAAAWQSAWGAGTVFSILQSAGAAASIGTAATVGTGVVTSFAVGTLVLKGKRMTDAERLKTYIQQYKERIKDLKNDAEALKAVAEELDKLREELVELENLRHEYSEDKVELENSGSFRNATFLDLYKMCENGIKERISDRPDFRHMRDVRNRVAHPSAYYVSKKDLKQMKAIADGLESYSG